MKNVKCPCCGIIIADNSKPIKEVKRSDVHSDSEIISKPEGMSKTVWERIVKGYNLRLIVED